MYPTGVYTAMCRGDWDAFVAYPNNPSLSTHTSHLAFVDSLSIAFSRQLRFFQKGNESFRDVCHFLSTFVMSKLILFPFHHNTQATSKLDKVAIVLLSERLDEGMNLLSHTFHLSSTASRTSPERVTPIDPLAHSLKNNESVHSTLEYLLKDEIRFYQYAVRRYLSDIHLMKAAELTGISHYPPPFLT
jgi:hypothetical protein